MTNPQGKKKMTRPEDLPPTDGGKVRIGCKSLMSVSPPISTFPDHFLEVANGNGHTLPKVRQEPAATSESRNCAL